MPARDKATACRSGCGTTTAVTHRIPFLHDTLRPIASRYGVAGDFTTQAERQKFIAAECYFQAVAVHTETRRELEQVEAAIIQRLQPAYVGRVGTEATTAPQRPA